MSNLHKNVILREQAEQVIAAMDSTFDSHQFIVEFILRYPQVYLDILRIYHYTGKAHGAIAACLQEDSKALHIERQGKVRSANIFGRNTLCELWRKV